MRVQTLPEWMVELAASAPEARKQASEVIRAAAFQCQGLARPMAPIDTGNLRGSISVGHPSGRDLLPGDLEAQVGPTAEYGHFVEYGTSKMAGRPYMNPAADIVEFALQQKFLKEVGLR